MSAYAPIEECEVGLVSSAGSKAGVPVAPCRRCFAAFGVALLGMAAAISFAASTFAGRPANGVEGRDAGVAKEAVAAIPEAVGFAGSMQDGVGPARKFPPLPCDRTKESPTLNTAKQARFVNYAVKEGDIVERGDLVAVLTDADAIYVPLKAAVPGVVVHIHAGLRAGMDLDSVMEDGNLATIGHPGGAEARGGSATEGQRRSKGRDAGPPRLLLVALAVLPVLCCLCCLLGAALASHMSSQEQQPKTVKMAVPVEVIVRPPKLAPRPLSLEFKKQGSSDLRIIQLLESPLGIEFSSDNPTMVSNVVEDSPAEKQGVQQGWTLTKIGDQDVSGVTDLNDLQKYLMDLS